MFYRGGELLHGILGGDVRGVRRRLGVNRGESTGVL